MGNDPFLRIAIFGASGRLGQAIAACALRDPRLSLAALLVHPQSSHLGAKMGNLLFTSELQVEVDLLIDVSIANGFSSRLELALERKLPLVLGTTGLSKEDLDLLKSASMQIPLFYTPNFSIGMALLHKISAEAAHLLSPPRIDIVETHHTRKKDAPSGSALLLAKTICESHPNRPDVPIRSIRSGETIGEHTLLFHGTEEKLTLGHEVLTRDAFARGALAAALFLHKRPPSLYSMDDLIS